MIEIRPIREHEADEFLELLCTVFGLELERARSVFFTEPMYDLQRKWALIEGPDLISILTTVPLEFGWGRGIGIAGVATREDRRNEGLASLLLDKVCRASEKAGETSAYLFAKQEGVYEKNGFKVLDTVVRGRIHRVEEVRLPPIMEIENVQEHYNAWALEHPARLRRDARRWRSWNWSLRVCGHFGDGGYVCTEGSLIREVLGSSDLTGPWEMPLSAEWVGLQSMTKMANVPLLDSSSDLLLMGRNSPGIPQMFMTDQF